MCTSVSFLFEKLLNLARGAKRDKDLKVTSFSKSHMKILAKQKRGEPYTTFKLTVRSQAESEAVVWTSMSLCPLTLTLGGGSCNTSIARMASTPHCAHLLHKSTCSQQPWCSSDSSGASSFSGHGSTDGVLLGILEFHPFESAAS